MDPIQISVWNGIVMGGGVGISVHAPIRIATEKTVFAMPETGIGFFTDVGGSYFLSRVNNAISDGLYLGITGHRLKGKDLLYWGVATHYIETGKLNDLYEDIIKNTTKDSTFDDIKKIVDKHSDHLSDGHEHSSHSIHLHREGHCLLHNKKCTICKTDENPKEVDEDTVIRRGCRTFDYCFQPDSIHNIKQRLESVANGHKIDLDATVAQKALGQISKYSPISCAVVTEQIKRGQSMTLENVFKMEYGISQAFMECGEFYEGVRALLIDKDNAPKWRHKVIEEVSQKDINFFFDRKETLDLDLDKHYKEGLKF